MVYHVFICKYKHSQDSYAQVAFNLFPLQLYHIKWHIPPEIYAQMFVADETGGNAQRGLHGILSCSSSVLLH
jgi:hypothetical protein